jgi:hypothetical protein
MKSEPKKSQCVAEKGRDKKMTWELSGSWDLSRLTTSMSFF